MSGGMRTSVFWRSVCLTLAMIAVALKVLTPPGFMVASTQGALPLVICTGHGPLILGGSKDPAAPAHKASDAPCAFAAASTPPTPSLAILVPAPLRLAADLAPTARGADQTPGRGLAAPPPPSHAPPSIPELT